MGVNSSTRTDPCLLSDDDVNFDHFTILRAIGKGSFGKVCIVQKRDTGRLFAMKYVSRAACESRGALGGVIKEVELLASLEHPFLVNLWFSFQDEEDLFMVCDLLTGGDLRYHLQQKIIFSEDSVALLICELGSALDYLQSQRVVHRDIKPDNILLDDDGHAHLTDFNIATRLPPDGLACSMSGTKPYMAPEVFMCALDEIAGYSFPIDWWSLGIVAYEMRNGSRPFKIHSSTPLSDVKNLLNIPVYYPRYWSGPFVDLLSKLLNVLPGARLSSLRELQQTPILRQCDIESVLKKKINPPFKPPEDHLNCDPSLELEEMIIETKPLHKKKKRLAKQRSAQRADNDIDNNQLTKEFIIYNRYKELKRKAMELKENEWQKELDLAMANSEVNNLLSISGDGKDNTDTTDHTTTTTTTTTTDNIADNDKNSTTSNKKHYHHHHHNHKNDKTNNGKLEKNSSNCSCSGGSSGGGGGGAAAAAGCSNPVVKDDDSIRFIDQTPSPRSSKNTTENASKSS